MERTLSQRSKAHTAYEQRELAPSRLSRSNPKHEPYDVTVKRALAAYDKEMACR